ncbi:MAG: GNAT family N-acetyltransferase [Gammaproteobacteria bacterium]|nr:GNAT family N-acetyltransferase [Gammaproteobacteria bacterium]
MEFVIDTAEALGIDDDEISALLAQVYVADGHATTEEAAILFAPTAVRERGVLLGAREQQHGALAGMIILVPPDSPARRIAQDNEAELHLLGVRADYRRDGLGRLLVETAIGLATENDYSKIILWTQHSMKPAQRLYESVGFVYRSELKRNGRNFKVYERESCEYTGRTVCKTMR